MRKLSVLLIITLLVPKQSNAQNNGATVAAAVGGFLAIGVGIAAVEDMKERAEKSFL